MPVNLALGHVSNDFLVAALVIYSLAVLAFAGDFAFGRPRRAVAVAAAARQPARTLAAVGTRTGEADADTLTAASGASLADRPDVAAQRASRPGDTTARTGTGGGSGGLVFTPRGKFRALFQADAWVRAGMVLSAAGVLAHTVAVITRGVAVNRPPWGNMYEFVTALTCFAALFFLGVMVRYRAWSLGVFVMGAVVVTLGLTETLIFTPAGDLVPALQSYWLSIHVTAMTVATGVFFVSAVLGVVYLMVDRHNRRVAAGRPASSAIVRRLPTLEQLDRLAYRTVVFGFPIWTFGVIAGAIWADQAWGRYWGWDPVETWAFITWVVYAAFLHARATAGWRGRRAHYVQLLGFVSLVFNIMVVQIFITGLHSYAGVK